MTRARWFAFGVAAGIAAAYVAFVAWIDSL
jgi:hypothetical protein